MSSKEEKIQMLKKEFQEVNTYNRPTYCQECGESHIHDAAGRQAHNRASVEQGAGAY